VLPVELQKKVEQLCSQVPQRELAAAAQELSDSYRNPQAGRTHLSSRQHHLAYLAARFPATYFAISRVLAEIPRLAPSAKVTCILDLGAGPGTATLAATSIFPALERSTLVERDVEFSRLGQSLQSSLTTTWTSADLNSCTPEPADLAIFGYSLGELASADQVKVLRRLWEADIQVIAIVEPGTPRGFANVLAARAYFIAAGAHIVAPCPHRAACPLAKADDWCHFAVRVPRTSLHRKLKGGELGYEDEKFSYLIVSRTAALPYTSRILRHPLKHKGHVQTLLCEETGAVKQTVSKKMGERYKEARDAEWGDIWPHK
jgi:ribosomal protein RSM22 (predicted rRNA methylase)